MFHLDDLGIEMSPEEWRRIERPKGEAEPTRSGLPTARGNAALEQWILVTTMRWSIERHFQDHEQEFGPSHDEGRGWQGFHLHATLCRAAYGFLVARGPQPWRLTRIGLDHERLPHPLGLGTVPGIATHPPGHPRAMRAGPEMANPRIAPACVQEALPVSRRRPCACSASWPLLWPPQAARASTSLRPPHDQDATSAPGRPRRFPLDG